MAKIAVGGNYRSTKRPKAKLSAMEPCDRAKVAITALPELKVCLVALIGTATSIMRGSPSDASRAEATSSRIRIDATSPS